MDIFFHYQLFLIVSIALLITFISFTKDEKINRFIFWIIPLVILTMIYISIIYLIISTYGGFVKCAARYDVAHHVTPSLIFIFIAFVYIAIFTVLYKYKSLETV